MGSYTNLRTVPIYDPTNGSKTAIIQGSFGTISETFSAQAAPGNVNLGSDWFSTFNRAGRAQFDSLFIGEAPTIPEEIFADRFQQLILSSQGGDFPEN